MPKEISSVEEVIHSKVNVFWQCKFCEFISKKYQDAKEHEIKHIPIQSLDNIGNVYYICSQEELDCIDRKSTFKGKGWYLCESFFNGDYEEDRYILLDKWIENRNAEILGRQEQIKTAITLYDLNIPSPSISLDNQNK